MMVAGEKMKNEDGGENEKEKMKKGDTCINIKGLKMASFSVINSNVRGRGE